MQHKNTKCKHNRGRLKLYIFLEYNWTFIYYVIVAAQYFSIFIKGIHYLAEKKNYDLHYMSQKSLQSLVITWHCIKGHVCSQSLPFGLKVKFVFSVLHTHTRELRNSVLKAVVFYVQCMYFPLPLEQWKSCLQTAESLLNHNVFMCCNVSHR